MFFQRGRILSCVGIVLLWAARGWAAPTYTFDHQFTISSDSAEVSSYRAVCADISEIVPGFQSRGRELSAGADSLLMVLVGCALLCAARVCRSAAGPVHRISAKSFQTLCLFPRTVLRIVKITTVGFNEAGFWMTIPALNRGRCGMSWTCRYLGLLKRLAAVPADSSAIRGGLRTISAFECLCAFKCAFFSRRIDSKWLEKYGEK